MRNIDRIEEEEAKRQKGNYRKTHNNADINCGRNETESISFTEFMNV
jgi:hypothetical protein